VQARQQRKFAVVEEILLVETCRRMRVRHVTIVRVVAEIRLGIGGCGGEAGGVWSTDDHVKEDTMTATHSGERVRDVDADGRIAKELIDTYRQNGFVRIRRILQGDEVERFRANAEAFLEAHRRARQGYSNDKVFTQLVNVWTLDETARELTLHPRIARVAEQLAGFPVRIWHDQLLVKDAHSDTATEFHQDRPYWPHANDRLSLSAWIALVEVPPERGCMTFLPGTQTMTGYRPQNLLDEADLFRVDPELSWIPRVTVPLRAGDCTFHSSYTGHMALPNRTDLDRLAHVNIYMDEATRYDGNPHVVTEPLGLSPGESLDGDLFPKPLH
jgi:phytanoyl-CoA hydroxylase